MSVNVNSFRDLLEAVKQDYLDSSGHEWDGFAKSLAEYFKTQRVDPKLKYSKFYSASRPNIVLTYTWEISNIFRIATVLDDRNQFREKTVWIDVLFTQQFDIPLGHTTSKKFVELTSRQYSNAELHLIILDEKIFTRAWCLLEIAMSSKFGVSIQVEPFVDVLIESVSSTDFFANMKASYSDDVLMIQQEILRQFKSPDIFNQVIICSIQVVRGAVFYWEAMREFKSDENGRAPNNNFNPMRDPTFKKAQRLLTQAAELEHAEATYELGWLYLEGKGSIPVNETEAGKCFVRSAHLGSRAGCSKAGLMYKEGLYGFPMNVDKASYFLQLATVVEDTVLQDLRRKKISDMKLDITTRFENDSYRGFGDTIAQRALNDLYWQNSSRQLFSKSVGTAGEEGGLGSEEAGASQNTEKVAVAPDSSSWGLCECSWRGRGDGAHCGCGVFAESKGWSRVVASSELSAAAGELAHASSLADLRASVARAAAAAATGDGEARLAVTDAARQAEEATSARGTWGWRWCICCHGSGAE